MMSPVTVFLPSHLFVKQRFTKMTELVEFDSILSVGIVMQLSSTQILQAAFRCQDGEIG